MPLNLLIAHDFLLVMVFAETGGTWLPFSGEGLVQSALQKAERTPDTRIAMPRCVVDAIAF